MSFATPTARVGRSAAKRNLRGGPVREGSSRPNDDSDRPRNGSPPGPAECVRMHATQPFSRSVGLLGPASRACQFLDARDARPTPAWSATSSGRPRGMANAGPARLTPASPRRPGGDSYPYRGRTAIVGATTRSGVLQVIWCLSVRRSAWSREHCLGTHDPLVAGSRGPLAPLHVRPAQRDVLRVGSPLD